LLEASKNSSDCPYNQKYLSFLEENASAECCTSGHDYFLKICNGDCGALFDPTTHGNIEGQLFWKSSYRIKSKWVLGQKS